MRDAPFPRARGRIQDLAPESGANQDDELHRARDQPRAAGMSNTTAW